MSERKNLYANVIVPLKYNGEVTYSVPPQITSCEPGCRVKVNFAGKEYIAVVVSLTTIAPKGLAAIKEIISVEPLSKILPSELEFWKKMAEYYLVTVGELYKAAYPSMTLRQEEVKSRKSVADFPDASADEPPVTNYPTLSQEQQELYDALSKEISGPTSEISDSTSVSKPLLLHGVTGSGKTEIYISLALDLLNRGKQLLFMVPEIAISKQLHSRLKLYFGKRLLVCHSKQTAATKRFIQDILRAGRPAVILGTRSSLFLPYTKLGLIIIDEEHDTSYKQNEPAPRYHAREAAIMLSLIHNCKVLLGSATPSLETLYNCAVKRFKKYRLTKKYYGSPAPVIEIIDTIKARKMREMNGSFSQKLINLMTKVLSEKRQILIFKNRRSYAPVIECNECGYIPKCPHCNVILSYHKYNNTLRCHYCDYVTSFRGYCHKCKSDNIRFAGSGTEKIEEEVKSLFPAASVARFDADITRSKRAEEEIIRQFSGGATDILIGTQMITKGFDFENLKLVVVLDADSILGIQDFRADEHAAQLFNQIIGRSGRREERGVVAIQTAQADHPILQYINSLQFPDSDSFAQMDGVVSALLRERADYSFAPFVRMIKITVKDKKEERLTLLEESVRYALESLPEITFTGPFTPAVGKIRGEWLRSFYIKLKRDKMLGKNKEAIYRALQALKLGNGLIIDVDPLS